MGIKGKKQCVKEIHVQSRINQDKDLYVDVPNMGQNDVNLFRESKAPF